MHSYMLAWLLVHTRWIYVQLGRSDKHHIPLPKAPKCQVAGMSASKFRMVHATYLTRCMYLWPPMSRDWVNWTHYTVSIFPCPEIKGKRQCTTTHGHIGIQYKLSSWMLGEEHCYWKYLDLNLKIYVFWAFWLPRVLSETWYSRFVQVVVTGIFSFYIFVLFTEFIFLWCAREM